MKEYLLYLLNKIVFFIYCFKKVWNSKMAIISLIKTLL